MKRLLLVPLLALCAIVLSVAPATAGPPEEVSGDWTYVPAIVGLRQAGPNLFIDGTDVGTWTGSFAGTSTEEFVLVCHPMAGLNSYHGTIEFTGYVDGRYGTLTLKTNGVQAAETCEPSPALWFGRWVIIGGTGDLTDLHGNGTFSGPSLDLDYVGQIHFD